MSRIACDVVVVGAGPTGLTIANLLGQAGLDVILVERNDSTVRAPRAVSIDDESLRTMQAAGLLDAVLQDVALDYGSNYFTAKGHCFLKVAPTAREYGFPRRSAFTQQKLEATLCQGLGRFPTVRTLFRHDCEGIAEDEDGVSLSVRGPAGDAFTIRARYVAASDGASSALRKAIGATLTGSTYRQRWLIVDLAETREQLRQTRVVSSTRRPLITLPGPGGIRRYEFMLDENEDEAAATHPDFVRDLLAAHGPDADAPVVRRQVYAFHARIADRWNTRRIFLAGDAAHLSPPFAGQGMNSGVRDAHNLSWKLAAVVRGDLGPDLLESYQPERAPHAWSLIQLAVRMGRVMMPRAWWHGALIQIGFRVAGLAPRIQAYFAQMKYKPKPHYDAGFLVPDEALGLVGRMFPQPMLELDDRRRVRLDDLLGNGFALVAYGFDAQRVAASAPDADFGGIGLCRIAILPTHYNPEPGLGSGVTIGRDVDGLLPQALPKDRAILVLLRPDRYVAAAVDMAAPDPVARLAASFRTLVAATWQSMGGETPSGRELAGAADPPRKTAAM